VHALLRIALPSLLTAALGCGAAGTTPASDDRNEAIASSTKQSSDEPGRSCRNTGAQPFLLHLGPEARADVEHAMKKGVPVVAFDCENVRVLQCQVDGNYSFVGREKREEVVQEATKSEAFDGKLVTIGELVTERMRAGAADLKGECAGATHFIRAATLGAFSMTLRKKTPTGERAVAARDGDLASCDAATAGASAPPAQCRAVARLELVPIARE
jgi:uncharacterized protein